MEYYKKYSDCEHYAWTMLAYVNAEVQHRNSSLVWILG